ncbi:MAG: type II CAAX endopeptidase family protein [Candidatus Poribacteria bacterium]|nr:type II CAAX endopeptidase family protein [Candidatus Poribacteria bacterium]
MSNEPVYPSVKQGVLLILTAVALLLVAGCGLSVLAPNVVIPSNAVITVAYILLFGGAFVYGFKRAKAPIRSILPIKPVGLRLYLPMAGMIVGIALLSWQYARLYTFLLEQIRPNLVLNKDMSNAELWTLAVAALLIAPLLEESLFRGLLLRGFLTHRSRWKAIWISALLFAVMHMNLLQFLPTAAIGAAFGWWRAETGSILPAVIGHFFYNLLALASHLFLDADIRIGAVYTSLISAVGVVLLLLGIWSLRRLFQNPLNGEPYSAETPPPK